MKINWKSVLNNLDVLSDGKFLLLCRMHHESFDLLHDLIKDHQVFRQRMGWVGNLLKQQYPIYLQLLIFQYSLGACGSDCNNKWISPHFEPFAFLWRELPQYCCPTKMISYNGHLPTKSYALAMKQCSSMGCPIALISWMAHCWNFSMHHNFILRITIPGKVFMWWRHRKIVIIDAGSTMFMLAGLGQHMAIDYGGIQRSAVIKICTFMTFNILFVILHTPLVLIWYLMRGVAICLRGKDVL